MFKKYRKRRDDLEDWIAWRMQQDEEEDERQEEVEMERIADIVENGYNGVHNPIVDVNRQAAAAAARDRNFARQQRIERANELAMVAAMKRYERNAEEDLMLNEYMDRHERRQRAQALVGDDEGEEMAAVTSFAVPSRKRRNETELLEMENQGSAWDRRGVDPDEEVRFGRTNREVFNRGAKKRRQVLQGLGIKRRSNGLVYQDGKRYKDTRQGSKRKGVPTSSTDYLSGGKRRA